MKFDAITKPRPGLVGRMYEIRVLPNTASELAKAIYHQKGLSESEAMEMAEYLDNRYKMSGFVPVRVNKND